MFDTILIANRGEIACRVARTCQRLGVRTVAVYSDADRRALHVDLCDAAWHIGGAAARDSYLRGETLIEVARKAGASAIHPGYGFLSENANFAEACAAAGLVFIGPPPEAIRAMGSKSAAKAIMAEAGVPLVPGYHGDVQDTEFLATEAATIGYPVLIKASAGGGGKGMRVVEKPADFAGALAAARREAAGAFGDDRVLIERYLVRPRHIEMQVFADAHGNVIHLNERDCSVQRRHQKVLEEAPAPGMAPERRSAMGEAACDAARAIGYVGAGTVEFIAEPDGRFYFMEMNTRLQVEHPVTEMITGLDLVEWQLRVAAGEHLPRTQEDIGIDGHAFEARIYAEDPARDFLPAIGTLEHLRTPDEDRHVRIDTGVREGDAVSMHYDPMIAKLISWDTSRDGALWRLRRALEGFEVVGVTTNVAFLRALASHPAFASGDVHTGFIAEHQQTLLPPARPADPQVLALAALAVLMDIERHARRQARISGDRWSPWQRTDGWRLNDDNHHILRFRDGDALREVVVHYRSDHYLMDIDGRTLTASARDECGAMQATLDGHVSRARVVRRDARMVVFRDGSRHELVLFDPVSEAMEVDAETGNLTAPMPGSVIAVLVQSGQRVERDQPLVILEAMKMEHTIIAPRAGIVGGIHYDVGDQVQEGAELLEISESDD